MRCVPAPPIWSIHEPYTAKRKAAQWSVLRATGGEAGTESGQREPARTRADPRVKLGISTPKADPSGGLRLRRISQSRRDQIGAQDPPRGKQNGDADAATKAIMLRMARDYERLAKQKSGRAKEHQRNRRLVFNCTRPAIPTPQSEDCARCRVQKASFTR